MQTFTIPLLLAISLIKVSYSRKQFFSQFILGQVACMLVISIVPNK